MKKIEVLCEIAGHEVRYPVYIGQPTPGHHRFRYQAAWLKEVLGARILEDSEVVGVHLLPRQEGGDN